jgi:large subunit ribosomal protein L6
MSRIGKNPIPVPGGVTVTLADRDVTVKGPKGELSRTLPGVITVRQEGEELLVERPDDERNNRAQHGLTRTLVANMVTGVTDGFTKVLEITGVGYRAAAQGRNLRLQLGYSHDVNIAVPEGLEVKTPDQTTVEISGNDRQRVGQLAAEIRRWRKPEPYKGKGIKYRGEYIFRKEGKKK